MPNWEKARTSRGTAWNYGQSAQLETLRQFQAVALRVVPMYVQPHLHIGERDGYVVGSAPR